MSDRNDSFAARTFFDTHMHAYNLSHPSLGAMGFRAINSALEQEKRAGGGKLAHHLINGLIHVRNGHNGKLFGMLLIVLLLPLIIGGTLVLPFFLTNGVASLVWALIVLLIAGVIVYTVTVKLSSVIDHGLEKAGKLLNLLFVMDYSISDYFLALEKDMDKLGDLTIGDKAFDKIALCPQMMDFSGEDSYIQAKFKGMRENSRLFIDQPHYMPKNKPFEEQEYDLFEGIADYQRLTKKHYFEFYPFRGIEFNENISQETFDQILETHFIGLPKDPAIRKATITKQLKKFPQNTSYYRKYVDKGASDEVKKNFVYAGFKVYPPLGFDPWPEPDKYKTDQERCIAEYQLEMLKTFYKVCEENAIPIISHCGGPAASTVCHEVYEQNTCPERWQKVLDTYGNLKLCFAHFGPGKAFDYKNDWTNKILSYINNDSYPNVYADISCRCSEEESYIRLGKMINYVKQEEGEEAADHLCRHIIFGTDFPMCLSESESFDDYVGLYSEVSIPYISDDVKMMFAEENPKRFIFGYE